MIRYHAKRSTYVANEATPSKILRFTLGLVTAAVALAGASTWMLASAVDVIL